LSTRGHLILRGHIPVLIVKVRIKKKTKMNRKLWSCVFPHEEKKAERLVTRVLGTAVPIRKIISILFWEKGDNDKRDGKAWLLLVACTVAGTRSAC